MSEQPLQRTDEQLHRRMIRHLPVLIAITIFASLSIWQAFASEGFLEADGCTHYMYARWAFEYPVYFVDIWGRPFKTALYAPAAATVGLIGVRLTSLAVAITIAFIAYAIARGQGYRWPALALIFTLAQPLVFLHSFSELTELPFANLLGFAFLAYQRKRLLAMTILAGLLPLSRPEGFGFVLLAAALLACHRKWWLLPVLAMPVMGWQIAGAILYREPQHWWNWLPRHWPYAGDSLYAAGPIWHFAALLPALVGPVLFPFVLIGVFSPFLYSGRGAGGRVEDELHPLPPGPPPLPPPGVPGGGVLLARRSSYVLRCEVLIAAIPLMILVGHSVLYALGKMASNGELRYLLIVAPFWALLAARGWEWVWERFVVFTPSPGTPGEGRGEGSTGELKVVDILNPQVPIPLAIVAHTFDQRNPHPYPLPAYRERELGWRSPFRYAAVAALAPVLANVGYKVLPLVQTEDWKAAARIAAWYETSGVAKDYPYIMAAHPGIIYAMDIAPLDPRVRLWCRETVEAAPRGTVAVWDAVYGVHNADREKSIRSFFPKWGQFGSPQPGWIADRKATDLYAQRDRIIPYIGREQRWMIYVSRHKADGTLTQTRALDPDGEIIVRDW